MRFGMLCKSDIFYHMLKFTHATERNGHLGMIPDPAQCPFLRSPLYRSLGPYFRHFLRRNGNPAAFNRFHYDDGQTFFKSVFQTAGTCLDVFIHVVVLNLTYCPVIVGIKDFFKSLKVIMIGETEITDTAVSNCAVGPLQNTHVTYFGPDQLV